jgi:hypothetical protein
MMADLYKKERDEASELGEWWPESMHEGWSREEIVKKRRIAYSFKLLGKDRMYYTETEK